MPLALALFSTRSQNLNAVSQRRMVHLGPRPLHQRYGQDETAADFAGPPRTSWEAMLRKLLVDLRAIWGEGSHLFHPGWTRWTVVTALGSMALLVTVVASAIPFLDDYLTLRRQRESLAALAPRLAEQQALIDLYQKRVRELRAEIDGWRELHARIWEPFGPDVGAEQAQRGHRWRDGLEPVRDPSGSCRREGRAGAAGRQREGGGGQSPLTRALSRPRGQAPGLAAVPLARSRPRQLRLRHAIFALGAQRGISRWSGHRCPRRYGGPRSRPGQSGLRRAPSGVWDRA